MLTYSKISTNIKTMYMIQNKKEECLHNIPVLSLSIHINEMFDSSRIKYVLRLGQNDTRVHRMLACLLKKDKRLFDLLHKSQALLNHASALTSDEVVYDILF